MQRERCRGEQRYADASDPDWPWQDNGDQTGEADKRRSLPPKTLNSSAEASQLPLLCRRCQLRPLACQHQQKSPPPFQPSKVWLLEAKTSEQQMHSRLWINVTQRIRTSHVRQAPRLYKRELRATLPFVNLIAEPHTRHLTVISPTFSFLSAFGKSQNLQQ